MQSTQERNKGSQSSQSSRATSVAAYPEPLLAIYSGQPVKVTHFGDVEGNSPSYLFVDSQGQSQWASQQDVQIVDPRVLPPSIESLQAISQALTGRR